MFGPTIMRRSSAGEHHERAPDHPRIIVRSILMHDKSDCVVDIRTSFGANLKACRISAKLSQEALAAKVGVDRAHISSMERGRQNITIITLWHIANALDVTPSLLLEEAPHRRPDESGISLAPARR